MSISVRDAIFREVASNLLIHREYMNPFPARLIIEHGRVRTENSNCPRRHGPIDPRNFTPVTKNPNIARFFQQIGYADELGSGMREMMKYGRAYGGADPQLIEGDIFRTIISVPEFSGVSEAASSDFRLIEQAGAREAQVDAQAGLTPWQVTILQSGDNGSKSARELLLASGHASRTGNFKKGFQQLLARGLLEMTIPGKPKSSRQKYRLAAAGKMLLEQGRRQGLPAFH